VIYPGTRTDYYVPIDQFIDGTQSLVEHASQKLLYHELSTIFELCTRRRGEIEATFVVELSRRYFGENSNLKILDLGCGVGRISKYLARNPGVNITGIDISSDLIAIASQQCQSCYFEKQDIRNIFLKEKFDVAICMWSTFNYLSTESDIYQFGQSVSSHLKSNGILIIDLPNHLSFPIEPYYETNENENFHVTIWIQKRVVGTICEGLYKYKIVNKKNGNCVLLSDQELHRIYSPIEVEQKLKQWFTLQAVYGNYSLMAEYDESSADRAILCFVNKPKL
jgi:2-polyprenyl-3-methyl-5-hydroxy-6-metoxy-1,4-benzoquinol methylase